MQVQPYLFFDGRCAEGQIMSVNGRPGYRKNPDYQTCC